FMCFGFGFHLFHFFLAQSATTLYGDLLFFTRAFIFRCYMKDTIGIDIEDHFDLRYATRSRRNAIEVEITKTLILVGQRTFTLQYMDLYAGLVIARCAEHFRFLC